MPLSDFFAKFGVGEGVPGLHPHAKLHCRGFKNVSSPHNRQNCQCLVQIAPKGRILLRDFFKIWHWRKSESATHVKFHHYGLPYNIWQAVL